MKNQIPILIYEKIPSVKTKKNSDSKISFPIQHKKF